MEYSDVLRYYRDQRVRREILDYCANRWIALAGEQAFIRYWPDGTPLKLTSEKDIDRAFLSYKRAKVRVFYASVNVYKDLAIVADLEKPGNILYTSPIWDIDGELDHWEDIVKAAEVIVDFLEKEGVYKSLFLKWSGEGIHVHIHEKAFSRELLEKYHSLNIAYSVVEYVVRRIKDKLKQLEPKLKSQVKVENVIDLKRVFTAPLSLHRRVDLACVCFKPDELEKFNPTWADPWNPRHNEKWREYEEGEADKLAVKAVEEIKGYPGWTGTGEKRASVELKTEPIEEALAPGKIGRFQVMALLQAARYYVLTGDLEKAKSFGLNRAIFYAWAKYYGRGYKPKHPSRKAKNVKLVDTFGEKTPVSERGWFAMGGYEQRPEDYDRQIASRINPVVPYEKAWKAAVEYVKNFPRKVLLDPQRFYKEVYEPVRDNFVERVVKGEEKRAKTKTLLDFFKQG